MKLINIFKIRKILIGFLCFLFLFFVSGLSADKADAAIGILGTFEDSVHMDGAWHSTISGNYAYVAAPNSNCLTILDISIVTNPTYKGSVCDGARIGGAYNVFVYGNYAYLTARTAKSFSIIDVADPANPEIKSTIYESGDARIGTPIGVFVSGNYAFVATHYRMGLTAINISDPLNPFVVSEITDARLNGAWDLKIVGNLAYVTSRIANRLSIVNVSNPAAMSILGSVNDNEKLNTAYSVDTSGGYAYVTARDDGHDGPFDVNGDRLTVVDIFNPAAPQVRGSVRDLNYLNGAKGVKVFGSVAYVTGYDSDTLTTVNIVDPLNPFVDVGQSLQDPVILNQVYGLSFRSGYLYVSSEEPGIGRLSIISGIPDTINPTLTTEAWRPDSVGVQVASGGTVNYADIDQAGEKLTIYSTASDDSGTVVDHKIRWWKNGVLQPVSSWATGGLHSVEINGPLAPGDVIEYQSEATDGAGNVTLNPLSGRYSFTVSISSCCPAAGNCTITQNPCYLGGSHTGVAIDVNVNTSNPLRIILSSDLDLTGTDFDFRNKSVGSNTEVIIDGKPTLSETRAKNIDMAGGDIYYPLGGLTIDLSVPDNQTGDGGHLDIAGTSGIATFPSNANLKIYTQGSNFAAGPAKAGGYVKASFSSDTLFGGASVIKTGNINIAGVNGGVVELKGSGNVGITSSVNFITTSSSRKAGNVKITGSGFYKGGIHANSCENFAGCGQIGGTIDLTGLDNYYAPDCATPVLEAKEGGLIDWSGPGFFDLPPTTSTGSGGTLKVTGATLSNCSCKSTGGACWTQLGLNNSTLDFTGEDCNESNPLAACSGSGGSSPQKVTGLSASPGNAQIVLNWTAPADGGSPITDYKVYRSTTSGAEALVVAGGCSSLGNVLTCTDSGLTNGTTYYYKVSAVNVIGEGPQSDEANATPAALSCTKTGGGGWYDSNWTKRKPIVLTEYSGSNLTNYQQKITITYDSDMQADFDDIRFTSSDGTTLINYWLESKVDSNSAVYWVKVPNIPASLTDTVYMYYGNAVVANTASYNNTFTKDYGESGLVGLWHMDEGAGALVADSSGAGKNGTSGGAPKTPSWIATDGGQWDSRNIQFSTGSSLSFDGVDDYVSVLPNDSLDSLAAGTFSVWAKLNAGADGWDSLFTADSGNCTNAFEIALSTESGVTYFEVWTGANAVCYPKAFNGSVTIPDPTNWHLYTYVVSATGNEFYVDGMKQIAPALAYTPGNSTSKYFFNQSSANTTRYYIGNSAEFGSEHLGEVFDGQIDEMRIYNRSLSAGEIYRYYIRSKYANPEPGLCILAEEASSVPPMNTCAGVPVVNLEGKSYGNVQIGNQCWMDRNMNRGNLILASTNIPWFVGLDQSNDGAIEKYCYNNVAANCDDPATNPQAGNPYSDGGLYMWAEAMQLPFSCNTTDCSASITYPRQGICPAGWHVPQMCEYDKLENYVISTYGANGEEELREGRPTEFNAPWAGSYTYGARFFDRWDGVDGDNKLWSSVQQGAIAGDTPELTAATKYLYSDGVGLVGDSNRKLDGNSVRCVLNTFAYSLSNSGNVTLVQGNSGSNTITATLISGTANPVNLSYDIVPAESNITLSWPTGNSVTPTNSKDLNINVGAATPTGVYAITVSGNSTASCDNPTTFNLTVNSSSNNPPTLVINEPQGDNDTIALNGTFNIAYNLSDLEDNATVSFYYDNNGAGNDGILIGGCLNRPETSGAVCAWDTTGVFAGTYYIYGKASDGVNPDIYVYSDTVVIATSFSYTISDPADVILIPSSSTTVNIPLTKISGSTQNVTLGTTAAPADVVFSWAGGTDSCSPNPNCTLGLDINVGSSPTPGSYVITITGSTVGLADQSVSFNLEIIGASESGNLEGFAWSDTVGWISFSSKDCDTDNDGTFEGDSENGGPAPAGCPSSGAAFTYGVQIDLDSDILSGYAWSDKIGWISFESASIAGCPSGTCDPRLDVNEFKGWARACSVFQNSNPVDNGCSGALKLPEKTGGWDGWISLSCDNGGTCGTSDFKVMRSGNDLAGWAWGSDIVGWISFCYNPAFDLSAPIDSYCVEIVEGDNKPILTLFGQTPIDYCTKNLPGAVSIRWDFNDFEDGYRAQNVGGSMVYEIELTRNPDGVVCSSGKRTSTSTTLLGTEINNFDTVPDDLGNTDADCANFIDYGGYTYNWKLRVFDSDNNFNSGSVDGFLYPGVPPGVPPGISFPVNGPTPDHQYPIANFSVDPDDNWIALMPITFDPFNDANGVPLAVPTESFGGTQIAELEWNFGDGELRADPAVPIDNAAPGDHSTVKNDYDIGIYTVDLRVKDTSNYECYASDTGHARSVDVMSNKPKWNEAAP